MSARHSFLSTTGLTRSASFATLAPSTHTTSRAKKSAKQSNGGAHSKPSTKVFTRAGVVPLGPIFLVGITITLSILFIVCISFAFVGSEDEPFFKDLLDEVAEHSPGIVLVGDNVDVDVDEPAITIRWSILGCGKEYVLPGSEGSHGSMSCGIPSMAINIFVDNDENATAMYDPASIPFVTGSSTRRSIQNLFQFDSDHVLDVHEARLYPFDTYYLTSTIRIVSAETNEAIPIARLPTLAETSSFIISSSDIETYVNTSSGVHEPARDLDLRVARPGEARAYTLLLFGVSWMLAHGTMAYVVLAWKTEETERILKYLAFTAVTLLFIPQLRNAMPDAPGFDGVLIDSIGFFPQMLMCGISCITLLATIAKRELQLLDAKAQPSTDAPFKEAPAPLSRGLHKLRQGGSSTSLDLRHFRAFSKSFSRAVPPSPISEMPESSSRPDVGVVNRSRGQQAEPWQKRDGQVVYSEWTV